MSKHAERVAITTHFKNLWDTAYPTLPVAWPNHEFNTPANSVFAVFNLVDRGTTRETLGLNYIKRHRGTLQIDIYSPLGQGVAQSKQISDYLETVYDTLDLLTTEGEVIMFRTPSSREVAGNEQRASNIEDNWFRLIVECPYDRQQKVTK